MTKLFRLITALCLMFSLTLLSLPVTAQDESGRAIITVENAASVSEVAALEGHERAVNAVAFSPDGTLIAAGYDDGSIVLWDIATLEQKTSLPPQEAGKSVFYVAFASPETLVAMILAGDFGRAVYRWDLETQESTSVDFGGSGLKRTMALSPDGEHFVMDSCDGSVSFSSNGITCSPIYLNQFDATTGETLPGSGFASSTSVWSIAYSPDGQWVAAATSDGFFRLYDADALEEQWSWQSETSQVIDATFSPDSSMAAAAVGDGTVRLYNIETSEEEAILDSQGGPIFDVAFNSDGTLIAAAGIDNLLRLWDVETQAQLAALSGPDGVEVRSVAFSPDGTLIASAGSDGIVRLWGVEGGAASGSEPAEELPGPAGDAVIILDDTTIATLQEVFVSAENDVFGEGEAPDTTVFPSGTQTLYILLRFDPFPSEGVEFTETIVRGPDGIVDLGDGLILSGSASPGATLITVSYPVQPLSGSFADGNYQAVLFINGVEAIELNWTVGGE